MTTLVTYAALVAVLYVSQRVILYPGAGTGTPTGERWGEVVAIGTQDGETLFGLHAAAVTGRPSVLFFLGNADRVGNYGFLARALSARGIGLLAISYRGYPGSTGSPSEQGLLVDGLAAFDWLAARGNSAVVLLGQSLGSGVAVNTAVERPAAAVILVSPCLSVQSLAQARYPFLPVSLLIRDPFRSDLRIGGVRQPKLFVHGRRDRIIPLSSGEALFAIAPDPKMILIYDDAGHNDVWNTNLAAEIVRFIEAAGP